MGDSIKDVEESRIGNQQGWYYGQPVLPRGRTYSVKSWTFLFQAIKSGVKTHDIRDMRDRDYKVGDFLLLNEFDPATGKYTGDKLLVEITYITNTTTPCAMSSACLDKNFCVLSVKKVKND